MPVSIVIVSYNSSALLIECVQAALASTLPVEVIVSDNGSTDGSVEPLEDLARAEPRLRVLRNGGNLGFARGNAAVLAHAGGDHVLFLNPDCLVRPDTLARMVATLAEHPEAGMAGCLIRNPDGSEEPSDRRRMPTPGGLLRQVLGRECGVLPPLPAAPCAVEAISGAFMLVRREALARVGSFDPAYFMHWEDVDLCQRFHLAGYRILFVPDVEVLHFKGRSSRRQPLRVEWHKHAGLIRYFRKFHFPRLPLPLFAPVALAVALRFLARAAAQRFRRPPLGVADAQPLVAAGPGEVWVFGASSLVGRLLLPRLVAAGYQVRAFCTDPAAIGAADSPRLTWHGQRLSGPPVLLPGARPEALIHLAPLPLLPPWIEALATAGLGRVIAFGSTSRYTKQASADPAERRLATDLAAAEDAVAAACDRLGVRWAVFRPTMIYCLGHERNVTLLAAFIRRFRFFPMPGAGTGRRQPVHADDLARACVSLLASSGGWNQAYNLSGGEVLSYRAMVEAIFRKLGLPPRIVRLPDGLLRAGLALVRLLPAYRNVNRQMLDRVNVDMCFDHDDATRNFGFEPRAFLP
jgi:GT2 family glycosyltransferase/nucleoside-diphosphate-sugar epimerase